MSKCVPETDKCDCEECTCGKQKLKVPKIIEICALALIYHRLALVYLVNYIEYKRGVLINNFWAEFAKKEREKRRNVY